MTTYCMELIMAKWVEPYVDTSNWEFYNLSCRWVLLVPGLGKLCRIVTVATRTLEHCRHTNALRLGT